MVSFEIESDVDFSFYQEAYVFQIVNMRWFEIESDVDFSSYQ